MNAKAYVLIETAAGKSRSVAAALRALPGVTMADAVTGPYDVIAVVQAPTVNDIGRLVMNDIHGQDGVVRTLTSVSVETTG